MFREEKYLEKGKKIGETKTKNKQKKKTGRVSTKKATKNIGEAQN